ncbi:hypothetical protein B0H13DRAFT_2267595 [Mycena leptocephala]|nr:hypothetical protein B0H13DRAFT_2267595 [Mycena leptocephala]
MSSGPKILVTGALNILQDLSNGSNIPALQPLVSVAVRIYTSAEGAKSNKKQAKALAQEVHNSIEQIKHVYPVVSSSSTQGLHEDGIREFQRALEDVATFVERIAQRNRFWRVLNQQEDRQELSDYRTKITEAKVQFLVAMEMAKFQILQREQEYPVFTLADLELRQTLNQTNPKHTRAIARLVPHQKLVILQRYHTKSNFDQDIESLMSLRHPNLPFLGASSLFAPAPFIVKELSTHSPVREVVKGLYRESPKALQIKAIEIITGVLDGMNHLRENDFALSDLIKQTSSIQYDGSKVILNVELPKHKSRSTVTSSTLPKTPFEHKWDTPQPLWTVTDEGFINLDNELFWRSLQPIFASLFQSLDIPDGEWVDIPGQENEVLQELFGLPEDPRTTDWVNSTLPSAFWPIWRYLMGCDLKRRLHDLRNISEKLCGPSDQVIDIPQALVATGNFPYQDFPPTQTDHPLGLGTVACRTNLGHLVVVCDLLGELRDEGIIDMDQFISTEIADDEEQANPSEELIRAGGGIFPEPVGDYTRYKFFGRPFSLEIGRTTTTSLHNPAASETRRRIQEYFHHRLPSLLEENSWVREEPTDGFVLVTSVTSWRSTQLLHNHDTDVEAQSEGCLQCMMYGEERPQGPQPDATSNQNLKINGVHFHALPEQFIALCPMEYNCWGCWTISEGAREIQLEPLGGFSYTYNPNCGFKGVFAQFLD